MLIYSDEKLTAFQQKLCIGPNFNCPKPDGDLLKKAARDVAVAVIPQTAVVDCDFELASQPQEIRLGTGERPPLEEQRTTTSGNRTVFRAKRIISELSGRHGGWAVPAWAVFELIELGCVEAELLRERYVSPSNPPLQISDSKRLIRESLEPGESRLIPRGGVAFLECYLAIWPTTYLEKWLYGNSTVTSDVSADPNYSSWPKPTGWDFRPSEAAFNGRSFPIQRKSRALLERFVKARGAALTIGQLKDDVWGEDPAEDATIRGCVSTLRNLLKKALELSIDPLPNVDEAAYKLII